MGRERERLTAQRELQGYSQERLAHALNVATSTVWRWEKGLQDPLPRQRPQLARLLDVSLEELQELLRAAGERSGYQPARPGPAGVADAAYVEALHNGTHQLVALDTEYGGNDVVRLAVRAFKAASARLASGQFRPGVELDLAAAAGEAGEVAAWAAYDADEQDLARQLNHEALLISRHAGDRDMQLFELANLAMQSIYLGRPAEALRIADDVLYEERLSNRITALFHLRRARALASMGDRVRSLDTLALSTALVGDGISAGDPPWTWWLDPTELTWHEGMCVAELDGWAEAVELFEESSAGRQASRPRSRYSDLAHLLQAVARAGAWREAEDTVGLLLPYVDDIGSRRTTNLLMRTIRHIERHRDSATPTAVDAAATLRERIQEAA